jgi:YesN/AraC family two-component response regulator
MVKLKVLIIDDSEIIRDRLSEMISEVKNVEIVGMARNAREGVQLNDIHKPDLVILDIRLPEKSGISIINEIKSTYPSPCVAILTNYPLLSYQKQCMREGADYFFDKASEFCRLKNVAMDLLSTAA